MGTKAKAIFVNSFKGGAGKTTLALTHCIDSLFHKKGEQYENIIYMDLDILGTGTSFLFKKTAFGKEKCFERTEEPVKVPLELNGEKRELYVTYLNPELKIRSAYGDRYFINHQGIAEEEIKTKVIRFIKNQIRQVPKTLFVLDCAPGFSHMEQAILQECYQMKRNEKLEIEEDYVTTLDSAHMQKCIHCLNDTIEGLLQETEYRNIQVIMNDLQDYSGYVGTEKMEERWEKITDQLVRNLRNPKVTIWRWRYSQEIAHQNIYGSESVIENHTDWYIFTDESFKVLYPKKKEETEEA